MSIKQATGWRGKADRLASKIIRTRAGSCMRCGSHANLQASHIISRRYSATRTDLDNIQCLCARCHMHFTHWPREFSHWITDTIGAEKYDELRAKANAVTHIVDWQDEYHRLLPIWEALEKDLW